MKNFSRLSTISSVIVLAFIVPQIAFAAWWNPLSWGIFRGSGTETQTLETRADDPEIKSGITASSTTSENKEGVQKLTNETPKVANSSWWNPFTWEILTFKKSPKIEAREIKTATTTLIQATTTSNVGSEIEQLKKEIEDLKKKQPTKSAVPPTSIPQKTDTVIQPKISSPVVNPSPTTQTKTIPEISQADLNKGANIKAQTITLLNKIQSDLSSLDNDYTNEINRLEGILNKSIGASDSATTAFVNLTTGYKNTTISIRNTLRGFASQIESEKRTMEGVDAVGYIKNFNPEVDYAREVQFVLDQKSTFLQYKAKYDDATRDWLSLTSTPAPAPAPTPNLELLKQESANKLQEEYTRLSDERNQKLKLLEQQIDPLQKQYDTACEGVTMSFCAGRRAEIGSKLNPLVDEYNSMLYSGYSGKFYSPVKQTYMIFEADRFGRGGRLYDSSGSTYYTFDCDQWGSCRIY